MVYGIIVGTAGCAVGIYGAINPAGVNAFMNTPEVEKWTPYVIGGFVFITVFLSLAPFMGMAAQGIKNVGIKKRLRTNGQRTSATILSIQDTGVTVNMSPLARFTVETQGHIRGTFNAYVSRLGAPRPGDTIEVIYDPANPSIMFPANQIEQK